jgi:pimeloyl-ACP methyl ester carboxylesterase
MTYEIPGTTHRMVETNGITMSVYEAGEGLPVVFSHGFPELAYSWRHQVGAVAGAGYRAIAPDQRGYGGTSRPSEVRDYDIFHLTDDLAGLLDALGEERAIFVGHDWGGFVVWHMPLLHPDRVAGVISLTTPYSPRFALAPTELFRMAGGENHYILWFQEPGVADEALARDVRTLFDHMMRRGVDPEAIRAAVPDQPNDFVEAVVKAPVLGDPLLDETELDLYASTFTETGFTGGLNWYRNFDHNWEQTPQLDGATIDVPSLMITSEWDPVLVPAMAQGMPSFIADLEIHMVERTGHWVQQDDPARVNELVLDWLTRRFPPT